MSFAFHGLGPLYWPRLTPKAAQKFGVTSSWKSFALSGTLWAEIPAFMREMSSSAGA